MNAKSFEHLIFVTSSSEFRASFNHSKMGKFIVVQIVVLALVSDFQFK